MQILLWNRNTHSYIDSWASNFYTGFQALSIEYFDNQHEFNFNLNLCLIAAIRVRLTHSNQNWKSEYVITSVSFNISAIKYLQTAGHQQSILFNLHQHSFILKLFMEGGCVLEGGSPLGHKAFVLWSYSLAFQPLHQVHWSLWHKSWYFYKPCYLALFLGHFGSSPLATDVIILSE